MRAWTTLLVAVLLLPAAPALAQAPGAGPSAAGPVLQDGTADVKAEAEGTSPGAVPAGRFAAADLTGLAVQETATDLTLTLSVASLASGGETTGESSSYSIHFAHHGMQYQVQVFRTVTTEATYYAWLGSFDPGTGYYAFIEQVPVTADDGAGTMAFTVSRDLLIDSDGAAPFPGRALTGFQVGSTGLFSTDGAQISFPVVGRVPVPSARIYDSMPDSGNGTVDWPIRFGLAQTGNALLISDVPVRSSNGEATTFVFTVKASNLGPAQRFHLAALGTPATWQVDLPSDLVEIPEGSTIDLPVLVSTPFAHQHGTLQHFVLEMTGADHPEDVGRVQLGVRYPQPPQPAGHHDTLFLHTSKETPDPLNSAFFTAFGFDPSFLYFNTLAPDDDEDDAKVPVQGFLNSVDPPTLTYSWQIPLSPALTMGLDFDLARQGDLKVPIDTVLPMPGAVLKGRFVHTVPSDDGTCANQCRYDDFSFGPGVHTTAATFGPTPAKDVGPNAKGTLFEAPIVATPAGDYLPFQPGATLFLELNLTFTRVDPFFGPHDAPKVEGGEMVLPLLEYHDPVDQRFSSLSTLMIEVQGEQQRMVNPGKTALYQLRLMNHGGADAEYDLGVDGANHGWARILGDARVTVPHGQERVLGIAVTAPVAATDGAVSDLVLTAVDAKDPTARTLARLLTTVDTDAAHPDDSAQVPGLDAQLHGKGSPMLGPAATTLALAALAVALRRRRAA
jgi:hypothetical protein